MRDPMDTRAWTFHLWVVTPMVMSGADPSKVEWRAASVKGLVRWWFRVAGGSRADEDRLFGHVHGDPPQASLLRIRVSQPPFQASSNIPAPYFGFSIRLNRRKTIPPGTRLTARFQVEPWADEADVRRIQAAIGLTFYLGNFGTRARKGYGSLIVEKVEPSGFSQEFPSLTPSGNWQSLYAQMLPKYLDVLHGPNRRIDRILYTNTPWRSLEQSYKAFRRALGVPHKAFLGFPFHPSERPRDANWPERHASPLIMKPLSENGPCIVTVLRVPEAVSRAFDGSPRPNLRRYSQELDNFLNTIQANPIWPR